MALKRGANQDAADDRQSTSRGLFSADEKSKKRKVESPESNTETETNLPTEINMETSLSQEGQNGEEDDSGVPASEGENVPLFKTYTIPLARPLIQGLDRKKYISPTEVQHKVLPVALIGRDCLLRAPTGSGKTLVFLIPLIHRLLTEKKKAPVRTAGMENSRMVPFKWMSGIKAIILEPTTELCHQVSEELTALSFFCQNSVTHLLLAENPKPSFSVPPNLHPSVLVAHPASLKELCLLAHRTMKADLTTASMVETATAKPVAFFTSLSFVALDEADLMFSCYGFEKDLESVFSIDLKTNSVVSQHTDFGNSKVEIIPVQSSSRRVQILMCSATLDSAVEKLSKLCLLDPFRMTIEDNRNDVPEVKQEPEESEDAPLPKLTQHLIPVADKGDKYLAIYALLSQRWIDLKCIIFTNSTSTAYRLKFFLERFGIRCALLAPTQVPEWRSKIIRGFNSGLFKILIAADPSEELENANTETLNKIKTNKKNVKEEFSDEDTDSEVADNDSDNDEDNDEAKNDISGDDKNEDEVEDGNDSNNEEEDNHDDEEDNEMKELQDDDSEEVEEETPKTDRSNSKLKGINRDDPSSTSRGIDYVRVKSVVNFDLPDSVEQYIHRVGRTARGKIINSKCMALSFACESSDYDFLVDLKLHPQTCHVSFLETFSIASIEGLRYRVEDVVRSATPKMIAALQLQELQAQSVETDYLMSHFVDAPSDLAALKSALKSSTQVVTKSKFTHLKTLPNYLSEAIRAYTLNPQTSSTRVVAKIRKHSVKRKRQHKFRRPRK